MREAGAESLEAPGQSKPSGLRPELRAWHLCPRDFNQRRPSGQKHYGSGTSTFRGLRVGHHGPSETQPRRPSSALPTGATSRSTPHQSPTCAGHPLPSGQGFTRRVPRPSETQPRRLSSALPTELRTGARPSKSNLRWPSSALGPRFTRRVPRPSLPNLRRSSSTLWPDYELGTMAFLRLRPLLRDRAPRPSVPQPAPTRSCTLVSATGRRHGL